MSGYLLDTHIFLWYATDPRRLARNVARLLDNPKSELFISAASVWEIAYCLKQNPNR